MGKLAADRIACRSEGVSSSKQCMYSLGSSRNLVVNFATGPSEAEDRCDTSGPGSP